MAFLRIIMGQTNQHYIVGQHITGTVEKLLPYGVFVGLDDNTHGYIRRRDLSWASEVKPHEIVKEGQRVEAVILKLPTTGRMLELSLKAASPDPWEQFMATCKVGDVVAGTVKDLMAFGVFVEVIPGVDGLIPLAELATWEVQHSEDILWIGDHVEAVVTRIDGKAHRVSLSMRLRIKQQIQGAISASRSGYYSDSDMHTQEKTSFVLGALDDPSRVDRPHVEEDTDSPLAKTVGRVLIVDDEVCEPLVAWLHRRGYAADAASTPEEARERIREHSYRIMLVDLDLAGADGMALIREMRIETIDTHIAIMSTAEWLSDRTDEIENLGVVEVFAKPLGIEEI